MERKNMEKIQLNQEIIDRINITTSDCHVLITAKSDNSLFFADTVDEIREATKDTLTDILVGLWTGRKSSNGFVYNQIPKRKDGSIDYSTFMRIWGPEKHSVIGDDNRLV